MVILEDFSFLTMTKASVQNRLEGLERGWENCHREANRCMENMRNAKNEMERDFWQTHGLVYNDHAKRITLAGRCLRKILTYHFL